MIKGYKIVKENGDSLKLEKANWANIVVIDEWFALNDLFDSLKDMEDIVAYTLFEDKINKGEEISINNKNYVKEIVKQIFDWCGKDKIKIVEV